jgi:hypothetical protein
MQAPVRPEGQTIGHMRHESDQKIPKTTSAVTLHGLLNKSAVAAAFGCCITVRDAFMVGQTCRAHANWLACEQADDDPTTEKDSR